jgi:uracil-DNA glycosylase
MIGPVVTPNPVASKVYLVGQAPGTREGEFGKPFAWTAGKTMFRWFGSIGINEDDFRNKAYMSAVCRCFPGKAKTGGDRVPSPQEITACSTWMKQELDMLAPELVIPVGRLAIEQFLPPMPLTDCVGKQLRTEKWNHEFDLIPLPHPSGASTWFKKDPGKTLLVNALSLVQQHPSWRKMLG